MKETVRVDLEANTGEIDKTMKELRDVSQQFAKNITNGLKTAVKQGYTLKQTLKSIALSFANTAFDAAFKPITEGLSAGIAGILGSIKTSGASNLGSPSSGGLLSSISGLLPFAKGGVISSPSYFPAGSKIGVMGEAGAEAVMPLARSSDGRLGVRSNSPMSAPSIQVHISSPDVESFRRSESQMTAALSRAVRRGTRNL